MNASEDPSWAHYAETILELFADRSLELDLTKPVPVGALGKLEEQGIGPTFAVLTACNPNGQQRDQVWNRRLSQALRDEIASRGHVWVPGDGVSRDRTHREEGVAVSIAKSDALELALKFRQSAFFWFDGTFMWILGAVVAAPDQRLPL